MMYTDFERVIDPAYLQGLQSKTLDEVRSMRTECQVLENSASYVRRFVQGRLDMVVAARTGNSPHSPEEISGAISGNPSVSASMARPPQAMSADLLPDNLIAQLNAIISPDDLMNLEEFEAARLDEAFEELTSFEQQVSTDRRRLHEIIDHMQAEIVRRYRSGEASIDGLLAD